MMLDNNKNDNKDVFVLSADMLLSCYHFTCAIPAAMLFLQRRARRQNSDTIENAVRLLYSSNVWYGIHFAVATVAALILPDIFGCRMIHSTNYFLPFSRI